MPRWGRPRCSRHGKRSAAGRRIPERREKWNLASFSEFALRPCWQFHRGIGRVVPPGHANGWATVFVVEQSRAYPQRSMLPVTEQDPRPLSEDPPEWWFRIYRSWAIGGQRRLWQKKWLPPRNRSTTAASSASERNRETAIRPENPSQARCAKTSRSPFPPCFITATVSVSDAYRYPITMSKSGARIVRTATCAFAHIFFVSNRLGADQKHHISANPLALLIWKFISTNRHGRSPEIQIGERKKYLNNEGFHAYSAGN